MRAATPPAASVGTPQAAEPAAPRSTVATQPTIPALSPAHATRAFLNRFGLETKSFLGLDMSVGIRLPSA